MVVCLSSYTDDSHVFFPLNSDSEPLYPTSYSTTQLARQSRLSTAAAAVVLIVLNALRGTRSSTSAKTQHLVPTCPVMFLPHLFLLHLSKRHDSPLSFPSQWSEHQPSSVSHRCGSALPTFPAHSLFPRMPTQCLTPRNTYDFFYLKSSST